ncbi:2-dehydro-3-deoxyphosphogluconate aldolase 4-hydroxy-2-oxoglutarate aldolase [Lactobacillus pasteurii DSM 23907 = CRBIP 24.76]|uniref:2-dehydro-3-deoxyphosphogluconate aldolase/4-hydroxy-2-oxoglutarate aldolase n=1 Tax=Lactobacillus pasteurii DSM 23907 = CRBIP 24.76 TaxID=1423790 RepID=I7KKJ0_9LACO|nr:bifunctional 4-hydroxy-2-oxoglutarate aldolase/2-dehydro-3-deoxy-phosphogluconate aldolase [Lactobacillus pasteurii]KRK07827.1 2-dehydro-3-deoxyphosphogluconate aldolase 4-hydroxy-2-oxoglutarate aldolase [Lactobacillus pasteurii DSM 23907 = CRBIP 24.76]TDG77450.1 hypothetical protein C5L33_000893 [Lactobacillus pasteurii]CCI84524.1 2-dehydro-3-deoxyphosphogluconate aldolase/4-hydroxy-2-oxoglutarate aldolase [Lactobacillus pasteurii DSM 23907 = CRBIP 24.76]
MQKSELLNKLVNSGVVAVIRGDDKEQALKTVDAVIAGGITAIELTFTVPGADQVISTLSKKYQDREDVIIGAGTVLEPTSARLAIINGAKFIVSPSFNSEVAKLCNLYCIPYTPGCITPTEIQSALAYGAELIKIFPGNVAGKGAIKAYKGPFPYVNIMPTGGVDLDNMAEWFKAGASVVGAGSNLTKDAATGNYVAVSEMAKKYRQKFEEIKS